MSLPVIGRDTSDISGAECDLCYLGARDDRRFDCIGGRPYRENRALKPYDQGTCSILFVLPPANISEDKTGIAASSGVFSELTKVLDSIAPFNPGLEEILDRAVLTHVVRCWSKSQKPKKRTDPVKIEAVRKCRTYLDEEIAELRPERIIALGAEAHNSLRPEGPKIEGGRLTWDKVTVEGVEYPVTTVWSPGAILMQRTKLERWVEDLKIAIFGSPGEEKESRVVTVTVETEEVLDRIFQVAEEEQVVSVDIETDAQGEGKIICVGISFPARNPWKAFVIPTYHPEVDCFDYDRTISRVYDVLIRDPSKIIVGQAIQTDLAIIAQQARIINNWWSAPVYCEGQDSQLQHAILLEEDARRDLGTIVKEHVPSEPPYKDEVDTKNLINTPWDLVVTYNGKDTVLPFHAIKDMIKRRKARGDYDPRLDVYNRKLVRYVANLQAAGLKISMLQLARVSGELNAKADEMHEQLRVLAGRYVDNFNSRDQVETYIYDILNCDLPDVKEARTDTGLRAVTREVLGQIKDAPPFIDLYLEWKRVCKQIGTYIGQIVKHQEDEYVYPAYFLTREVFDGGQGGAKTGRMSAKRPSIQTFTKKTPDGRLIQTVFVSRYEGGSIMCPDGSQMETRVGAQLSRDTYLVDLFRAGEVDFHQQTADDIKLKGKAGRKSAKVINFGIDYGSAAENIARAAGISVARARQLMRKIKNLRDGYYKYLDGVAEMAREQLQVFTSYGRPRHLPEAYKRGPVGSKQQRQARNFIVQGTANDIGQLFADFLAMALFDADTRIVPIFTQHDGFGWDVPKDCRQKFLDTIETVSQQFPRYLEDVLGVTLIVPLVWDVEEGPSWGQLEEVESYISPALKTIEETQ